jgi:structural maintenance of chromosome 2
MEKDIVAGGQELAEARTHLTKTSAALAKLQSSVDKKHKDLRSIEAKIAEETKMLTAFKDELDALDGAIKAKRLEIADGELAIKELEHEIDRLKKDQKGAVDAVAKLEKQFEWISDECQWVELVARVLPSLTFFISLSRRTFGKEGSPYNFTGVRMGEMKKKCQQLEEDQAGMKKKVNPKVLTMIDRWALSRRLGLLAPVADLTHSSHSVEKKEKDLKTMYQQVLKDKTKIEETVTKLDEYKKEALQTTWEKVNECADRSLPPSEPP